MTNREAIEMIKAKKKCLESETSGRHRLCSDDCDDCDLNYMQGNMGEQIEWLGLAIKAIEEQDKHRWIPVSEGLPPEHDTMFTKLKGTPNWNNSMFEKISDDVNVTIELEDGTRITNTMHTIDGEWKFSFIMTKKKVIAWMPLPEYYKQG